MNVIAILAFFGIITTAYARIRICRKYSLKGIKYPDEKDCSKYYLCRFGLLLSKQCDDGLLYSPVSASCVPPQQSGCKAYERYIDERNKEYCNIAGDSALFPNVLRCNQFYECANGVPVKFDCPAGLIFNDLLKVCDYPDTTSCVQVLQFPFHVELLNENGNVEQEQVNDLLEEEVASANQ